MNQYKIIAINNKIINCCNSAAMNSYKLGLWNERIGKRLDAMKCFRQAIRYQSTFIPAWRKLDEYKNDSN